MTGGNAPGIAAEAIISEWNRSMASGWWLAAIRVMFQM